MSTRLTPMCPEIAAGLAAHGAPPPLTDFTCVGSRCALWRPVVKNPSGNGCGGLRDHFDPDGYEDTGDGVCAKNPDARPWADPAAS